MVISLRDVSTKELREIEEEGRRWLKENATTSMYTHGSGLSMIWAFISERNINSMLGASFGALVVISFILIFALRSFKLGLVSLISNIAPALMAFGAF